MAANPLPTPTLSFTTEHRPTESIVRCAGRITNETAPQLRQAVRGLINEGKRVVLDFKDVSYIDSSGLGMVVGLVISARKTQCELKFINMTRRVRDLFILTRVIEELDERGDDTAITTD